MKFHQQTLWSNTFYYAKALSERYVPLFPCLVNEELFCFCVGSGYILFKSKRQRLVEMTRRLHQNPRGLKKWQVVCSAESKSRHSYSILNKKGHFFIFQLCDTFLDLLAPLKLKDTLTDKGAVKAVFKHMDLEITLSNCFNKSNQRSRIKTLPDADLLAELLPQLLVLLQVGDSDARLTGVLLHVPHPRTHHGERLDAGFALEKTTTLGEVAGSEIYKLRCSRHRQVP